MAAGTPVVASDLPIVRELADESTALLAKPGSTKSLKDALLRLAADPAETLARAERARRHVEARFDWRVAQAALRAVYAELGVSRSSTEQSAAAS
jgi:glycosyltransferase involved in cell wall biosynthesis